eukprot:scaffold44_cov411-Prasinococcus_capsulatus_cf.AAC.33
MTCPRLLPPRPTHPGAPAATFSAPLPRWERSTEPDSLALRCRAGEPRGAAVADRPRISISISISIITTTLVAFLVPSSAASAAPAARDAACASATARQRARPQAPPLARLLADETVAMVHQKERPRTQRPTRGRVLAPFSGQALIRSVHWTDSGSGTRGTTREELLQHFAQDARRPGYGAAYNPSGSALPTGSACEVSGPWCSAHGVASPWPSSTPGGSTSTHASSAQCSAVVDGDAGHWTG